MCAYNLTPTTIVANQVSNSAQVYEKSRFSQVSLILISV